MSITHSITYSFTEGSVGINNTVNVEVDAAAKIDDADVPTGTTNREYLVPVDKDALATFLLHSTKDVTVKTNSTSTPGNTFTLKANDPLIWRSGNGQANPLSADVTSWFVSNASGETGRFRMIAGFEPTP